MSYQVLARKWRPKRFEEMVGQGHVLRALINALDHQRLHHAYLFTGTRGVGKTTVARIFAKSLNCEKGISASPCGECGICREVDEGRFVDLVEVDAASKTKVEDTRELLENVFYTPARGRFKVYLIDEVHMLSTHSFNALLKTLEEPPEHVKFLLATTDPQKLPVTILSRCLQFGLKRLSLEQISTQLNKIVDEEGIDYEAAGLKTLARAADGSMRDGLSLLDQAISHGGGAVRADEVDAMLGTIDASRILEIAAMLAQNEPAAVLSLAAEMAATAVDFNAALEELTSLLHRVAVIQVVPGSSFDDIWPQEEVVALAQVLAPEDVQLFYQIALKGRQEMTLVADRRQGFEMTLLRMLAFRLEIDEPAAGAQPQNSPAVAKVAAPSPATVATPPSRNTTPSSTISEATRKVPQPQPAPPPEPVAAIKGNVNANQWSEVVQALKLRGMATQLALHCVCESADDDHWVLRLAPAHSSLNQKNLLERLNDALSQYLQRPVKMTVRVADEAGGDETPAAKREREEKQHRRDITASLEEDPNVQTMKSMFDARVLPDSIRDNDET